MLYHVYESYAWLQYYPFHIENSTIKNKEDNKIFS